MVDLLLSSLSTHDKTDEKWSDILSTISPMSLVLLLYITRWCYFNRHIFLENVAVQCFIFSLCIMWRGGYHIIRWYAIVLQKAEYQVIHSLAETLRAYLSREKDVSLQWCVVSSYICVVAIIIQKACIEADVLPRIKYIELLFNLYLLLWHGELHSVKLQCNIQFSIQNPCVQYYSIYNQKDCLLGVYWIGKKTKRRVWHSY